MRSPVLIAGMFRSGTTLLSSLLSDHPQGMVISDPFVYFFKLYRDFHLKSLGLSDWLPGEPTPDYFGGARRELFDSLMAADLHEAMPKGALAQMIADIREWKSEQHPELCRRLDEVQAETFAEAYEALIDLSVEVNGKSDIQVAGTKVSWCEEFLPAMARAFPHMRFILPVRDLRAIVASQNSQTGAGIGRRPLLFYVRHWRKSVALAHHFANEDPAMRDRVKLVRYEDLVAAPETSLKPILSHVGLPQVALEVSAGTDGRTHNSSFSTEASGIFTGSTERWREVLTNDEIQAIEALAGPELALLGYSLSTTKRRPLDCVDLDCEPPFDSIAEWLKPFPAASYLLDSAARKREYLLEEKRLELIEQSDLPCVEEERNSFLVGGFLPYLRQAWSAKV